MVAIDENTRGKHTQPGNEYVGQRDDRRVVGHGQARAVLVDQAPPLHRAREQPPGEVAQLSVLQPLTVETLAEGQEVGIHIGTGDQDNYIKAVQEYNTTVRSFPTNLTAMVFGHKEKPQFTVENEREISKAPKVDFGSKK